MSGKTNGGPASETASEFSVGVPFDAEPIVDLLRTIEAGGVYLWKSKKDAAGLYTKEWENVIRERYGAQPTVTYFESPVVVDNLTSEIISDS